MELLTDAESHRIVENFDISAMLDDRELSEAADALGLSEAQLRLAQLKYAKDRYATVLVVTTVMCFCMLVLSVFTGFVLQAVLDAHDARVTSAASLMTVCVLVIELVGMSLCFSWRERADKLVLDALRATHNNG